MSFKDKVAIVTGASSGIGAATALLLAGAGADVALVARSRDKLEHVAAQVHALGRRALVVTADLSKDIDVATVVPKTVEHFGKLDILINNAGIAVEGTILDGKGVKAYDQVMQTNVRAVIQLTSDAAPHLAKTKGNVVNVSSGAALRPSHTPRFMPYYVSKAALDHFTRCAAVELAASGVRVNTVNPGPVDNAFLSNNSLGDHNTMRQGLIDGTVLGYMATNEDIGAVILFLASDKARSVTGSSYVMDNGWTLKH